MVFSFHGRCDCAITQGHHGGYIGIVFLRFTDDHRTLTEVSTSNNYHALWSVLPNDQKYRLCGVLAEECYILGLYPVYMRFCFSLPTAKLITNEFEAS